MIIDWSNLKYDAVNKSTSLQTTMTIIFILQVVNAIVMRDFYKVTG
jgi:hypothetical protein